MGVKERVADGGVTRRRRRRGQRRKEMTLDGSAFIQTLAFKKRAQFILFIATAVLKVTLIADRIYFSLLIPNLLCLNVCVLTMFRYVGVKCVYVCV